MRGKSSIRKIHDDECHLTSTLGPARHVAAAAPKRAFCECSSVVHRVRMPWTGTSMTRVANAGNDFVLYGRRHEHGGGLILSAVGARFLATTSQPLSLPSSPLHSQKSLCQTLMLVLGPSQQSLSSDLFACKRLKSLSPLSRKGTTFRRSRRRRPGRSARQVRFFRSRRS